MKKIVLVLSIGLPLSFTAPGAILAQNTTSQLPQNTTSEVRQSTTSQKVCSIFVPGNWRDTVTVTAPGWYTTQCDALRRFHGASQFQLGCFYEFGYSFGEPMSGVSARAENFPSNNSCNWQND